ncbi:MAG: hypothetical protein RL660_1343 [Bacteroidota bacterium]
MIYFDVTEMLLSKSTNIVKDLSASLIVFLVALPLCLGIALASKAPEFSGLIAGVVGGIVVGLLSGSPLSVSGPAAGLSSLVAASLMKVPTFEAFLLAVVIAGVIQILLGICKLGVIGDYVPNSVIKGMLAGIGLTLILKQFSHLIGYDKTPEADETIFSVSGDGIFSEIASSLNGISLLATLVGVVSLAILIFFEMPMIKKQKWSSILSGPLVAVLVGVLLEQLIGDRFSKIDLDPEHFVQIPIAQTRAEFFSFFTTPDFSSITNGEVWVTAITVALVASLETLLGIEAVDKLDPLNRSTPTNKELIAQGAGNIISGLVGGLPITSVIVRSSANVNAGATSKLSTIFHGLLLLIAVIAIPNLLNLIPKAALAGILIFTGYKLIKPSVIKHYWNLGWNQFIPFIVTTLAVVSPLGLLKGVMLGIGLGLIYVVRTNFRDSITYVHDGENHLIKLRKDTFFFSKPLLKNILANLPDNATLIVDISQAPYIDRDIKDSLEEFNHTAKSRNINVELRRSDIHTHEDIDIK